MSVLPVANIKGLNKKLDRIKTQFSLHYGRGEYKKAIVQARAAHKLVPRLAQPLADIAACYIYLGQWREALRHAQQALALSPDNLPALDAAAHALGELDEQDKAKPFGAKALSLRNAMVEQQLANKAASSDVTALPLLAATIGQKIIAFSLFGNNPKYCETAYLNVLAQPAVYPGWVCRFYVDDSVPTSVKTRLLAAGAQVVEISKHPMSHRLVQWYGTVWRFLALDDDSVERVIFRDADALISQRESSAVTDWISSGKKFHLMRDSGSHTELILAGMWGCVRGALPSMYDLLDQYLSAYTGSVRFTDQFFLRENVWPYAKDDCLHHDAFFDYPGSIPFPLPFSEEDWRVGGDVNTGFFEYSVSDTDTTMLSWALVDHQGQYYCEYSSPVHDGRIKVSLPRTLLLRMQAKELRFRAL